MLLPLEADVMVGVFIKCGSLVTEPDLLQVKAYSERWDFEYPALTKHHAQWGQARTLRLSFIWCMCASICYSTTL